MTDVYTLELAHVMPGRIRLRWRGGNAPSGDLIDHLRAAPGVREVELRAPNRSLIVLGDDALSADALRRAASAAEAEIVDPPEPRPVFQPKPAAEDPKDRLYQDVEAALLVIVMFSWIRDLIVNRIFRLSTVLLVIITAMDLYRHWLRRQAARQEKDPGLEVMEA